MTNCVYTLSDFEALSGIELPKTCKYRDKTGPNTRHLALLINYRTGKVIASAWNSRICTTTESPMRNTRISIHAEQRLIRTLHNNRQANRRPESQIRGTGAMISLRVNRNGSIGQSTVCRACADMIAKSCKNISHVMYVDENHMLRDVTIDEMCAISIPSSGDKRRRPRL
jgi:hypothetical protein